jgi:hypothetical protein
MGGYPSSLSLQETSQTQRSQVPGVGRALRGCVATGSRVVLALTAIVFQSPSRKLRRGVRKLMDAV